MALGNGAVASGVLASPRHYEALSSPTTAALLFTEHTAIAVSEIGIFSAPRRTVIKSQPVRTLVVRDVARTITI